NGGRAGLKSALRQQLSVARAQQFGGAAQRGEDLGIRAGDQGLCRQAFKRGEQRGVARAVGGEAGAQPVFDVERRGGFQALGDRADQGEVGGGEWCRGAGGQRG